MIIIQICQQWPGIPLIVGGLILLALVIHIADQNQPTTEVNPKP